MSRMSQSGNPDRGDSSVDQLKEKASEIGQNLREMGGQARHVARDQYDHLRERASDYIEQGRQKAREWEQGMEHYIQERPVKSLLVAVGIGVLAGLLWRRR